MMVAETLQETLTGLQESRHKRRDMEYTFMKDEERDQILQQRITNYEQQHYAATLDIQVAKATGDSVSLKEAETRLKALETAMASLKGQVK